MASLEVRVYAVVFADFPAGSVSDEEWQALMGASNAQSLSKAILAAAQGRGAQCYITHDKRSLNASYLRLYTMLGFEVDRADVDALTIVLDTQATIHGVTGSTKTKFEGVLQAELRIAAQLPPLGYTQQQADKLSVDLVNQDIPSTFERAVAIEQAQAYVKTNTGIWHAPEE